MEDASGRPATTAADRICRTPLRLLGQEVAIGAPWSKTMDKPMVGEFMEASGFEVVIASGCFLASIDLGRVGPETAYELGRGPTGRAQTPSSCRRQLGFDAVVERLRAELASRCW